MYSNNKPYIKITVLVYVFWKNSHKMITFTYNYYFQIKMFIWKLNIVLANYFRLKLINFTSAYFVFLNLNAK